MSIKIGVVIVSYDSGHYLDSAIASIYKAAEKSKFQLFSCVVDNHPQAKDSRVSSAVSYYVNPRKNLGFGAGCNLGIEICLENFRSDYILLLNPDAALKEDFFEELEKIFASSPEPINYPISPLILLDRELSVVNLGDAIGLAQEACITLIHGHYDLSIYDENGVLVSNSNSFHVAVKGKYWLSKLAETPDVHLTWVNSINPNTRATQSIIGKDQFSSGHLINNAGSYVNPPYTAGDIAFENLYLPEKWSEVQKRSAWCGACVLLSKEYLEKVGTFNEDFFLYFEDIEMSLRGVKKGLAPVFFPKLVSFHGHSKSTSRNIGNRNYNVWRSRSIFAAKGYGLRFAIALFVKLSLAAMRNLLGRTRFKYLIRIQLPEIYATARGILRAR